MSLNKIQATFTLYVHHSGLCDEAFENALTSVKFTWIHQLILLHIYKMITGCHQTIIVTNDFQFKLTLIGSFLPSYVWLYVAKMSTALILFWSMSRFFSTDAYDIILGHLGRSHPYLSRTDYPTIENSASAINLGIATFYENGGSKDINITWARLSYFSLSWLLYIRFSM